jgi:hypothetical protein
MTHYEDPDNQHNYPGEPTREADRVYRTLNDDHRRTTQRSPLSRTSSWGAVFLMGGWRLALAIILIFFIVVNWALLGNRIPSVNMATAANVTATVLPDATMLPTMTVSIVNAQVRVNGTGAAGLFLRKAPSRTAEVLKTLPDGTTLQVVGANKTVEDVVWRNVRDSDGNEGWVSAGYVVPIE